MGQERKLWCDEIACVVKDRYSKLLASFVKHCDSKDTSAQRNAYICHLDDGSELALRVHPMMLRKIKEDFGGVELYSDISRIVFEVEDDTFSFVIPREWVHPSAKRYVYVNAEDAVYSRDELQHEVMSFIEDYL